MPSETTATPGIGPLAPRRMITDSVFDALMAQLIDGRIPAGSPLNIDRLAREFGVSSTPVREALARLEATRLVQREALRGYFVAPAASEKELTDLMDARLAIEPMNARLASAGSDAAFGRALDATVLDFDDDSGTHDELARFRDADTRFHQLLAERADNPLLLHAFESLGGMAQRFRQLSGMGISDARLAMAEHRAIADAVEARDGESAARAMTDHIEAVRRRWLSDAASTPRR